VLALFLDGAGGASSEPPQRSGGVAVEQVDSCFAGDRAGLRVGDVLLSWRRESGPDSAAGDFAAPIDVWVVETEQVPRGRVSVTIRRDGERTEVRLVGDRWGIAVDRLVSSPEGGLDELRSLGGEACYRALMTAKILVDAGADESAVRLLVAVLQSPEASDPSLPPLLLARLKDDLGSIYSRLGRFQDAAELLSEALQLAEATAPQSLRVAGIAARLGLALRDRGDYQAAEGHLTTAKELARALAPGSMTDVTASANFGLLQYSLGHLAEAAEHFEYAYRLIKDTDNRSLPGIINSLGLTASRASDQAGAERYFRNALEAQKLQRWTVGRSAETLELDEIRRRIAPGTLLLSFATGEESGYVFALGPASDEFAVHSIPLGRDGPTRSSLPSWPSSWRIG
jgi:tetratricopeptide (TPR) repeat protein